MSVVRSTEQAEMIGQLRTVNVSVSCNVRRKRTLQRYLQVYFNRASVSGGICSSLLGDL